MDLRVARLGLLAALVAGELSATPRRRRSGIVKTRDLAFAKKKRQRQIARASRQLNRRRAA